MTTLLVTFFLSLLVGACLTAVVRNQALARGWLDQAKTSRKIHRRPVPRLGGLAIVAGFFAPLCGLFCVRSGVGAALFQDTELVGGLFLGGLLIALLGLYDDLKGAGARLKLAVQCAVALLLFHWGFRIELVANPFGTPLALGVYALPMTVFWMVGVMNAMNLVDGLDGLAGGVAFFAVATNFALSVARGDVLMCLLMAALGGAVLGFLIFNFNPASIFMGDTGSMFLGFVLAAVSLKTSTKSGTAVAILVPIISLGLPLVDTSLAVVRRTLLGWPLFSADKEHIHHRLMSRLLFSQRRAVLVLYGLCCLFTVAALALNYATSAQSAMLLLCLATVVIVLMRQLGYLTLRSHAAAQNVPSSLDLRALVRETTEAVGAAETLESVWAALGVFFARLGAARLELHIVADWSGLKQNLNFEAQNGAQTNGGLELRVELKARARSWGELALRWPAGRARLERDEELAVEITADAVAKAAAHLLTPMALPAKNVVAMRP